MLLSWEQLNGRNGHEVAYQLLEKLYFEHTGKNLPEIRKAPQGKPYFTGDDLYFSISHTKNHAFCCLFDQNVGIDAEPMDRPMSLAAVSRFLSADEIKRVENSDNLNDVLVRFWVLKEAYAKLTGRGLGNYLRETTFSPFAEEIHMIDGCYVAILTDKEKE